MKSYAEAAREDVERQLAALRLRVDAGHVLETFERVWLRSQNERAIAALAALAVGASLRNVEPEDVGAS